MSSIMLVMKTVLIFLLFFFVGSAIVMGYHYWASFNNFNFNFNSKPAITTKFSLANAPSDSLRGEITSFSGTVDWFSRTAAKPVVITSVRSLQQGEKVSTGSNGKAQIIIQNDAAVSLSSDTDVSIIQLLPQNFVFLQDKGSVVYQNTQNAPVNVRSFGLVSIFTNSTVAYSVNPEEQTITAIVKKGTMQAAYEDSQNNSQVMTAQAGQTIQFDETTNEGTVQGEPIQKSNGPPF